MLAYYSLIRHFSEIDPNEMVSVGVLVGFDGQVELRLVPRQEAVDPEVVSRFKELLEHILGERLSPNGSLPDPEVVLFELSDRRFSQFRITHPRSIACVDDVAAVADDLARRIKTDAVSV